MIECTKGLCERPAEQEIALQDGRAVWWVRRCEDHSEVSDPFIVVERRPVQQTLDEVDQ